MYVLHPEMQVDLLILKAVCACSFIAWQLFNAL
jgi:hypothetical protein